MKKRSGKKFLACLLALTMAVSLAVPALAYDAYGPPQATMEMPNPYGRTVTYKDIDGGQTYGRTDTSDEVSFYESVLIKSDHLRQWVELAYIIFEANEHTWMDLAGDGWDTDYGKGHYMDFLYDMQFPRDHLDTSGSNYGVRSSGLTVGSSLKDAQTHAARDVAELVNRDADADDILKHHQMDLIDNTAVTSKPVLYTVGTVIDQKGQEQRWYYSSFGIVFYDFQLHVIGEDGPVQGKVLSKSSTPTHGQVVLAENYNYDAFEDTAELTISTEQTASSSITNSESYSFGQQVGGTFSLEKKLAKMDLGFEVNLGFEFGQTMETAYGKETSTSQGTDNSTSMSISVPAHTKFMGEQTITQSDVTTAFDCPVGVSYKVAIFSMNGDFYDDGVATMDFTGRYAQTSFVTLFGSDESAPDAMESLYQRATNHALDKGYDQTYGDTWLHSYEGGTDGPHYLDWEEIMKQGTPQSEQALTRSPRDNLELLQSTYPMSLAGAQMTIAETTVNTVVHTAMPLYPIQDIYLNWQVNRAFELEVGESMDFNAYRVKAYDKDFVEYYGFMPYTGTWKLVNAAGQPVTSSPVGHMVYDPVTLEQLFVADGPGTIYVKYFIPDGTYYTWDGVESTNDSISSAAYKIVVSEAPQEEPPAFEGTLTLEGTGAATVGVRDNLNNLGLVVTAKDSTDVEVEIDYTWRAQETASKGIEVQPDGSFLATQPGTFHVRVECDGIYSNWVELVVTEPEEIILDTKDHTFDDVDYDDWHNDAVGFVFQNGLMKGNGDGTFGPDDIITRGMMVQTLANNEDFVQAAANAFADVDPKDWYAKAVNWAAANGIAVGEYGKFLPNEPLAREALATFLVRWLDWKGYDLPEGNGTLADFPDGDQVSDWAKPSVERLVAAGVLSGHDDGTLDPRGSATRAEYAALLQRTLEQVL